MLVSSVLERAGNLVCNRCRRGAFAGLQHLGQGHRARIGNNNQVRAHLLHGTPADGPADFKHANQSPLGCVGGVGAGINCNLPIGCDKHSQVIGPRTAVTGPRPDGRQRTAKGKQAGQVKLTNRARNGIDREIAEFQRIVKTEHQAALVQRDIDNIRRRHAR